MNIAPRILLPFFSVLVMGCGDSGSKLDTGSKLDIVALRKQEPSLDAINRKFKSEGGFAGMYGMPDGARLMVVNLRETSITNAEIELLDGLSAIDEFDARNTDLGDAIFDVLLRWPRLRSVHLSGTKITDAGAERLAELPHLKHVSLSETGVTRAVVDKLRANLRDCKFE